jgi:hypothetical protein
MKIGKHSTLSDELLVRTTQTNAYKALMVAGKHPERKIKLAGARVDLARALSPRLVVGLPMPTLGINRDLADAYVIGPGGKKVRGDGPMRDALGIGKAVDLIRAIEATGQGQLWTGLGNLGMNKFCSAWQDGILYHSQHDTDALAVGIPFDACIWHKGEPRHVTFERVRFVSSNHSGQWEPWVGGRPIGKEAQLIVCGQRLVERGTPIDACANADSRAGKSYIDTRHQRLNAFVWLSVPTGERITRDYGLDQILSDPGLRKAAIEGGVVPLRLELRDWDGTLYRVLPDDLREAFEAKSYHECGSMKELQRRQQDGERGLFLIDDAQGWSHVVYAYSPYPLHFLAVRENGDGVLYDCVVSGFSNNAGCTVVSLALDLRLSGFTEALLLDNGGDVVMVQRNHGAATDWPDPNGRCAVVPSSLKRTQWAGLLLYCGDGGTGIEVRLDAEGDGERFRINW